MDSYSRWLQEAHGEDDAETSRERNEGVADDLSTSRRTEGSKHMGDVRNSLRRFFRILKSRKASQHPACSSHGTTHTPSLGSSHLVLGFRAPTLADVAHDMEVGAYPPLLSPMPHRRATSRSHTTDERRFAAYYPTPAASQCDLIHPTLGGSLSGSSQECAPSLPLIYSPPRMRPYHRGTHRPEHVVSDDPPPRYQTFDPNPVIDPEHHRPGQPTAHMCQTMRTDGLRATAGKFGKSVLKMTRNMPIAVKEVHVKLNSKRARGKIMWLEKHNFLIERDRVLVQQLSE